MFSRQNINIINQNINIINGLINSNNYLMKICYLIKPLKPNSNQLPKIWLENGYKMRIS